MSSAPRLGLGFDITSEQATALLDRLATDEDFRAEVESDPAAALGEYGILIEGIEGPVAVPSPEEIENFRRLGEPLQSGAEAALPFMPCLVFGALAYASAAGASGGQAS